MREGERREIEKVNCTRESGRESEQASERGRERKREMDGVKSEKKVGNAEQTRTGEERNAEMEAEAGRRKWKKMGRRRETESVKEVGIRVDKNREGIGRKSTRNWGFRDFCVFV